MAVFIVREVRSVVSSRARMQWNRFGGAGPWSPRDCSLGDAERSPEECLCARNKSPHGVQTLGDWFRTSGEQLPYFGVDFFSEEAPGILRTHVLSVQKDYSAATVSLFSTAPVLVYLY